MKKLLKQVLIIVALIVTNNLAAQITIGSMTPPLPGALLDLKEDGITTKGLGLPRVELNSSTKLQMGANPELTGTERDIHVGLLVYNTSETPPFCKGLYVWDGQKWQRLQEPCMSVNISPADPFYFLSGQNGSTITPQTLNVTWYRPSATIAWANTAKAPYSVVDFTAVGAVSPLSSTWVTPQTVSLTPGAMSKAETDANPFLTKESELTFTASENGKTISQALVVNQTNKAITIDGSLEPRIIENPASGSGQNTLRSNAKWKLAAIEPNDGSNTFSDIKLDGNTLTLGAPIDWEQNNNTGEGSANNLSYTVSTGPLKARYNTLTFTDAESPKRFNDITLSIYQCGQGVAPTMSQWAAAAGFADVPTVRASLEDDQAKGIDTPNPTTGIAWHRDQDGNIFLSASFDSTSPTSNNNRWMITNLAAKTYAPGVIHEGSRTLTGPSANGGMVNNLAVWGYPNGGSGAAASGFYNGNPRVGLLYTWDAATAGKGGPSGSGSVKDGGSASATRRQGICPTGWHLPSDYEWTVLENQIIYRTATYSDMPDINSGNANVLPQSGNGWRGTLHGKAMKEWCEPFSATHQGASNPIFTTVRGGFNGLLIGYAFQGSTFLYGMYAIFWTASGDDTFAFQRSLNKDLSTVERRSSARYDLNSVRCKKD